VEDELTRISLLKDRRVAAQRVQGVENPRVTRRRRA
jgi:hypothetical protein